MQVQFNGMYSVCNFLTMLRILEVDSAGSTAAAMSSPGNPNGQNHGVPGYTNNTRDGFGKSMSSSDPDRHCQRRTNPRKAMKCESCRDYNQGVSKGACTVCHHKNSIFR